MMDSNQPMSLVNRSLRLQGTTTQEAGILTLILEARMQGQNEEHFLVAMDVDQSFLRKKLQESDLAEMLPCEKRRDIDQSP